MIDFAGQRLTMVDTQLRPNEVTNVRLLAAMTTLPRERFVPERFRALAYSDETIEVFPETDGAPARFLLAPMVLARLIQLAAIEPDDEVLDIGCATGYSTAILSRLGRSVVGVEPEPELARAARRTLRDLDLANADIVEAPLRGGCPKKGPYDVILMNGSVPAMPEALLAQLREGGRLAAILSPGARWIPGKAYLFIKAGGEATGMPQFDGWAPPLPGFSPEPAFSF
jgi:protein-L-isoaspartate(D-aspartate) O-methyltransferase